MIKEMVYNLVSVALSHDAYRTCLPKHRFRLLLLKYRSFLFLVEKKALGCAIEGQLWGPALVLATQLGVQFYDDTVKQMALQQLVAGSPLRTLCLLIAGQPAGVFPILQIYLNSLARYRLR